MTTKDTKNFNENKRLKSKPIKKDNYCILNDAVGTMTMFT